MDRSLVRFYAGIKSDITRKTYESDLKRFLRFVKIKDAGGLLQLKDSYLQELVEDYAIFLKKKGLRYNSVNCAVSALETFFFMNDKSLNFKKIRKMMPEKLKLMGGSAWTTEDIKRMLESTTSLRNKAIIHLLASSGCRKGAVIGLKLRNVSEMPDGCKAILFYEGSKEEYTGFVTPEASKVLDLYLQKRQSDGEVLRPDSALFRNTYQVGYVKVKPMSYAGLKGMMGSIIKKIRGKGDGKRQEIASFHGFRKRFNTILKNNKEINLAIGEKLMGHSSKLIPLDTIYHTPSKEVLFGEFEKAIPDLVIDSSERERVKRIKVEEKVSGLELGQAKKMLEMESKLKSLSSLVEKLLSQEKD
ncbi:MAG: tyrosine-type recombinase/integrase [Thaumarchaeota archaeon]|nr:tyrosine-type recombinase/integrase [Nitrososphaerota archaeon]